MNKVSKSFRGILVFNSTTWISSTPSVGKDIDAGYHDDERGDHGVRNRSFSDEREKVCRALISFLDFEV